MRVPTVEAPRGAVLLVLICAAGCAASTSPRASSLVIAHERTVRASAARADVHYVALPSAAPSALPLVFLHPWGADLDIWADVAPALARDRSAILVDLLAHGGSSHAPGRYPPRRLAQAVLAAMDDAGLSRAILIGNSLGAATALAVDELAPERVAGLVLVGTPGAIELPALLRRLLQRAVEPESLATVSPQLLSAAWHTLAGASTPARDRMIARAIDRRVDPSWPAVAAAQCSALDEVVDYAPPLESIRAPTLVVHGADDRVVRDAWARALAARIPGARLEMIEDCGHFPQSECPERFVPLVQAFVRELR